jgi:hypothetical protein
MFTKLKFEIVFVYFQAFKQDQSYVVWSTICGSLSKIQNLVADTDYSSEFKQFSLDLMSEIVKKVGWEKVTDEPHVQGLLRGMILSVAGMLGHQETLAEAR